MSDEGTLSPRAKRFVDAFSAEPEWRHRAKPGEPDAERNAYLQGWARGYLWADSYYADEFPVGLDESRVLLARAMLRASVDERVADVVEREAGEYWRRLLAQADAVIAVIDQMNAARRQAATTTEVSGE